MAQEDNFKKEVTTKEDGRYLIYYDFTSAPLVEETKQNKGAERK